VIVALAVQTSALILSVVQPEAHANLDALMRTSIAVNPEIAESLQPASQLAARPPLQPTVAKKTLLKRVCKREGTAPDDPPTRCKCRS